MNKVIRLLKINRSEFLKNAYLIELNRESSQFIYKEKLSKGDHGQNKLHMISGFYFEFYDWIKKKQQAALFLENEQLVFHFNRNEYVIEKVRVRQFLFWKKIIINSSLILNVYSPIYTLFIATDMFPEDIEPIYGKFKSLQTSDAIREQIKFLKDKYI